MLAYLPPYSPDFHPIENAFAKLKALLLEAVERTIEGRNAIGRLVDCAKVRRSSELTSGSAAREDVECIEAWSHETLFFDLHHAQGRYRPPISTQNLTVVRSARLPFRSSGTARTTERGLGQSLTVSQAELDKIPAPLGKMLQAR
jgi:hypothetical protein